MNRNLLLGAVVATLFCANASHADFTFHSGIADVCENISGNWAGTGKAYNWFIGDCIYRGSGNISTPDATGDFTLDVVADKDSGSFICPKHAAQTLHGICVNGVITIKTDYGNLLGNFSENTGDAQGTLSVAPGMSADISIQFQRVR